MITLTEALAEITLIENKVAKKRDFIEKYLTRDKQMVDPLAEQGGAVKLISEELQAIRDLEARHIVLRSAIAKANASNSINVNGTTRTIADWIVWKREVYPVMNTLYGRMSQTIQTSRPKANIGAFIRGEQQQREVKDIVVAVSEVDLSNWMEELQESFDLLDGQLSLKNATITIEV